MLSMSTSYYVGVENGQMTLHVMAILREWIKNIFGVDFLKKNSLKQ